MQFESMLSDDLIDELNKYEEEHNEAATKRIYEILNGRNDIEDDFWREVFYESEEWVIRIISGVRNPLSIHEAFLIQSNKLFRKILNKYKINMDDVESVIDILSEECNNKKIKILLKKFKRDKLQELSHYFENDGRVLCLIKDEIIKRTKIGAVF